MTKILTAISLLSLTAIASNAAGITPAHPSGRLTSDSTITLQEISISAFKQTGRMWSHPVAETTISRNQIEDYGIVTLKDASELTPNFYIPAYGSRMTSSIYVRGLGARIDQPVVGMNVDNVPILNKDNFDFDLIDIQRIEVLRGPQSTLFGRNTMGGLVNIYTLSPFSYQGIRIMAEYGRANSIKQAASVYTAFSPKLAMGISAYQTSSDGFYRNTYTGNKVDKERQTSLRWKTAWRPSTQWAVDNTASFTKSRQGGFPYASLATGQIAHNDTCFYKRDGFTDGLSVTWTGNNISVASATSLQYMKDNMTLDQDFLPDDYFTLSQRRREWAVTQDFIVKGSSDSYSWLAGLFGFARFTYMDAPVRFKQDGIERLILQHRNEYNPDYPIKWDEDSFTLGSDFYLPAKGIAIYHTSDYTLGRWKFTLGMRVGHEKATMRSHSRCNTSYTTFHRLPDGTLETYSNTPVNIKTPLRLKQEFTEITPKFAITYTLPGLNKSIIYISAAKGYKSGGYNTQMFSDLLQQELMALMGISSSYSPKDIVSYKPEKSWNYELGTHLDLCNGLLRLDAAAFYISCRDQQLTTFPNGSTTGRIMTNAGRTRSFGCEIAATAKPTDRIRLNASWGHTNARFTKYHNGVADMAGRRLPYAPANTLFLAASYTLPLSSSQLSFSASLRGTGRIYWDDSNTVSQPFYILPSAYAEWSNSRVSIKLWGENISNTKYNTFYFVSIGNAFVQKGNPWTAGLTLRINIHISTTK